MATVTTVVIGCYGGVLGKGTGFRVGEDYCDKSRCTDKINATRRTSVDNKEGNDTLCRCT